MSKWKTIDPQEYNGKCIKCGGAVEELIVTKTVDGFGEQEYVEGERCAKGCYSLRYEGDEND